MVSMVGAISNTLEQLATSTFIYVHLTGLKTFLTREFSAGVESAVI